MLNFLNRAFKFLEVDDPKQTKVNRLFFVLIFAWIGFGFLVNIIGQLWYYFITVSNATVNQSSFLQVDGLGFSELAKQGGGYLIAAVFATMFWLQWKYYSKREEEREKDQRSDAKENVAVLMKNAQALEGLKVLIESQ